MPSSRQKAICPGAISRVSGGSASSKDPGMRARLLHGNREISGLPSASRAAGRTVKAGGRRP
jgi:hypothetical protein